MIKNKNVVIVILIVVLVLALFGGYGMMNFFGGHYDGFFGLNWLFGIIAIIAAIWVIYDVIVNNKRLSDGMKVLWIVLAVLFSIITAIIYYLIGRDSRNDLFRRR